MQRSHGDLSSQDTSKFPDNKCHDVLKHFFYFVIDLIFRLPCVFVKMSMYFFLLFFYEVYLYTLKNGPIYSQILKQY